MGRTFISKTDSIFYIPEWDSCRDDFRTGRDPEPVTVELRPMSAADMRAIESKLITRVRKDGKVETPNKVELDRQAFCANVGEVRNLSIDGVPVTTGEELYEKGPAALIAEIGEALVDWSKLEAGRRDRLSSQFGGKPQATRA